MTPCYNEEANVREIYEAVKRIFAALPQYRYEHIFIDNASKDNTATILRDIAAQDHNVKVIFNTRNFGHIRSPYYGLLQCRGDAVIGIVCDFQDPPELIPQFLQKWEQGNKIVLTVKIGSDESRIMFTLRSAYYHLVKRLSDIELIPNATGSGLFDHDVIESLRKIDDPYPYFRGLLADIGYPIATIAYHQPARRRGLTKNNFYTLYDIAMLGITNHSKVPLRLATMAGFAMSAISLLVALGYLVAKLTFWAHFAMGVAPVLIGLFFFSSVQLFFIGILGEYIGAIHTQVQKRPLVIEKQRLNFEADATDDQALQPPESSHNKRFSGIA